MKKVISITLSSLVFAIEEDAYQALETYLNQIKSHLEKEEDVSEIVADIELAIAEKFTARKRSKTTAVTALDVQQVIEEMGSPAAFLSANSETEENKEVPKFDPTVTKKRLYRDPDDQVIAGVASGLAQYFDIDPVIVRIIFVISVFFDGLGILAYIILWLAVPLAETTAERYAMRGEKITLKEITERAKKNFEKIDEFGADSVRGGWPKLRSFFQKIFDVFGVIVRGLVKVLRYVMGLVLTLFGALGLAGLVSLYSIDIFSDKAYLPTEAQNALATLINSTVGSGALLATFVVGFIPLVVVILIGTSLLVGRNLFTVSKSVSLGVTWVVAIALAVTLSFIQLEQALKNAELQVDYNNQPQFIIKKDNLKNELMDDTVNLNPEAPSLVD